VGELAPGSAPSRATAPGRARSRALAVVLAVATLAIYVWAAERFRFVSDDAFISYRYSKHVAEGLGLVWNPGERVEGYTSFLWIWVGAAAIAVGLSPLWTSVAITSAAGLGILAALVLFSARRTRLTDPWIWLAPLLLACNRTFAAWTTGGLATQLFAFLVLVSTLRFLWERKHGKGPVGSALLFALTTLTRPEGILFAFVAGCVFLYDVALRRQRGARQLLTWVVLYFALVGGHVLWRRWFYGFWLPNTFYAKVTGLRLEEALRYLDVFRMEYRLTWFLPLVLVPVVFRRQVQDVVFTAHVLIFTAYVLYVGGDWMEFRFLNAVLPFLAWLMVEGLRILASAGAWRVVPRTVAAVAIYAALLTVTFQTVLRDYVPRGTISDVTRMKNYSASRESQGQQLRDWVERGLLPADLRLAVGGAGGLPYASGLYTVDVLGWNDVRIAHQPVVDRGRIGHERSASFEYLAEKRVDVIDVLNGVVFYRDPATYPRAVEKAYYRGPTICLRVEEGIYLVFATALSDADFERRFGHLERVF